MGTEIRGKPHTSPLDGTEAVPLSPDGFATTAEIAALGTGGGGGWIYGDGSDGDLILNDTDTWVPGNYHDVTIVDGATARISSVSTLWPIFRMTGTFTINGILDLSGVDAVDRNGAALIAPGIIGAGGNGGQTDGVPTTAVQAALGLTFLSCNGTPMGGAGGDGVAGNGGTAPFSNYQKSIGPRTGHNLVSESAVNAPIGGSGGGGDSTNYGGGGGSGGWWPTIAARNIVHGPNNVYLVNGGAGAPGGDDGAGVTGNGDCGGGGGGAAAYWITIYDTIDAVPAHINTVGNTDWTGTGGLGGAGCGTGTDGSPGDDGFVVRIQN